MHVTRVLWEIIYGLNGGIGPAGRTAQWLTQVITLNLGMQGPSNQWGTARSGSLF